MAGDREGLETAQTIPMDAVQQPRRITKADVPRFGDRVRDVLTSDLQHRSAWEVTIAIIGVVLLMTSSSVMWGTGSTTQQKVVESIVALALVAAVSTAIL